MSELQSYNILDKDYEEGERKKKEAWIKENNTEDVKENIVVADLNMI